MIQMDPLPVAPNPSLRRSEMLTQLSKHSLCYCSLRQERGKKKQVKAVNLFIETLESQQV